MINEYQLFSEWRNRTIYGETLLDAVNRAKKLQRPDVYGDGKKIEDGEWVDIAAVKQVREHNTTRDNRKYESVIFEATDGRYLNVDAINVSGKVRGDRVD